MGHDCCYLLSRSTKRWLIFLGTLLLVSYLMGFSFLLITQLLLTLLLEVSMLSMIMQVLVIFVLLQIQCTIYSGNTSLVDLLVWACVGLCSLFFQAHSVLVLYICFELSLLPVLFLLLLFGYQPERILASTYLIVYTVIGSLPLLYWVVQNHAASCRCFGLVRPCLASVISLAFLVKSPLYGLHLWLPKAHVEAPLVGSILLSGILLKLGGYGFLLLSPSMGQVSLFFLFIRLLGSIVCSVLCFRSWDVKSVVAYSSVVHMGLVTTGALAFNELGSSSAVGILVCHSLVSPLLFVMAQEYYLLTNSRALIFGISTSISSLLLLIFLLLIAVNFGLPPALSFWVEVALLIALGGRSFLSTIPLLFSAFLAFVLNVNLYILCCGGPSSPCTGRVQCFYVFLPGLFLVLVLPLVSF